MSASASISQSKQNTVILPELKSAGTFASPDSVASSPGSNAIKVEGAWNRVNQSFSGDVGFTGAEVTKLLNEVRQADNEFVAELGGQMNATVSEFAETITIAQTGETGQFEKLFKNFSILIGVVVFGVAIMFFGKGKK